MNFFPNKSFRAWKNQWNLSVLQQLAADHVAQTMSRAGYWGMERIGLKSNAWYKHNTKGKKLHSSVFTEIMQKESDIHRGGIKTSKLTLPMWDKQGIYLQNFNRKSISRNATHQSPYLYENAWFRKVFLRFTVQCQKISWCQFWVFIIYDSVSQPGIYVPLRVHLRFAIEEQNIFTYNFFPNIYTYISEYSFQKSLCAYC